MGTLGHTGADDPTERLGDTSSPAAQRCTSFSTSCPSSDCCAPAALVQPQQVPKPHLPRGHHIQDHTETPNLAPCLPLAFLASSMCLSCPSRLPCTRGGGGRSHWQLWRILHPDHGPPSHSPPVRVPLPTVLTWPFGVRSSNLVLLGAWGWGFHPCRLALCCASASLILITTQELSTSVATTTSAAKPPWSCPQASRSWRDIQGSPGASPG